MHPALAWQAGRPEAAFSTLEGVLGRAFQEYDGGSLLSDWLGRLWVQADSTLRLRKSSSHRASESSDAMNSPAATRSPWLRAAPCPRLAW